MRMPELHDLLERRASRYEPPQDLFDRVLDRRRRRDRNRRIATAAVALAVAAAGIGGVTWAFLSGPEPRPADQPSSRFVGTWTSTELDVPEGSQTMTIRPAEDGALDIALHDDSSGACSTRQTRTDGVDTPSTLTGTGRLEDATTLVVPSPVLACADGREPADTGFAEEEGGTSFTLVLDLATGRLFDNLGVAWHRGATPENGTDTTEVGSERTGPGTYAMLGGEVTFHATGPWIDHVEAYIDPRLFFLIGRDDDNAGREQGLSPSERYWQRFPLSITILANPLPEASCAAPPGVPGSAELVVRDIRSNPDLETTVPVAESVGGIEALRLDVAAVPGASTCISGEIPVLSVAGREAWGDISHGDLGRLYVLDLPGGFARALAIWIRAPEAAFERAVEAAAPVLDSFEFHTG
jgi:hypothetical protein